MPRIQVNGIELNVFDAGSGPPVLFVHGFPLNHAMWRAQLDSLAPKYRVIAPDLRGFGGSDVTEGTVSMEQFADDLAALLDALGVTEPVTLCGLSMGGYIAWQFVRKHSGRLRGLILCDTKAAPDTADAAAQRHKTVEMVLSEGMRPLVASMQPKLLSEATLAARPEVLAELQRMMARCPPAGVAAALRGMAARPDANPLLASIRVPTLVLCGADDKITPPSEMRKVAAAIPGAEYVEVPEAGHMSPMEQPETVNAAMWKFLHSL